MDLELKKISGRIIGVEDQIEMTKLQNIKIAYLFDYLFKNDLIFYLTVLGNYFFMVRFFIYPTFRNKLMNKIPNMVYLDSQV